ncbi:MAG TPA: glycosyltransferase [Acidimicrobiales bacterium]|nr:glycosyltransferase [Acidimicrobiales bacterium]
MRQRIRRYAAVGVVATVVDVTVFLIAHAAFDQLVGADILALAVAALTSAVLHRWITLRNDPYVRWVQRLQLFIPVVIVAGAVDVVILLALAQPGHTVFWPKVGAVALAAVVRVGAHRSLLFRVVRREQDAPSNRPVAPGTVRLSVVVPAYHEEGRIGPTVERLRRDLVTVDAAGGLEIVVVDDGSGDETAAQARAAGADLVLVQPKNRGKGAAVRAGVLSTSGRTVVFTDADLAYAPAQIITLLTQIEDGWDVVVGNRRHVATATLVRARRIREIGGRLVNLATHALLLGQYRDTQCGLKAFRSDVARLIFSATQIDGFAFDVEIFHLVERLRLSLAEVPVTVENSERSTVKIVRDGLRLVVDIVRVRWWAREGRYFSDASELPPRGASATNLTR